MARVKTAKEKITAYLKAKGIEAGDIQDAFNELDAADADLGQLAESLSKNEQWNTWYQTAAPEIQKIAQERDTYKSTVEKLQAAGFTAAEAKAVAAGAPVAQGQPSYMTKEEAESFRQNLAQASSDVMKDLIKLNFRHYREFQTEADLDAVENLMKPDPQTGQRKAHTVNDAYRQWAEPMYEKKRKDETERQIVEGIKKGVQAELSKSNVPGIRRQKTQKDIIGVENAPLDKAAPSEHELRQAFVSDLNEEITH